MDNKKTLLQIFDDKHINALCGGKKTCGKCRVIVHGQVSAVTAEERKFLTRAELDSGIRLACMVYPEGDYEVQFIETEPMQIRTDSIIGNHTVSPLDGRYGIAVDIGTTTVAVYLCNLRDGTVERTSAFKNPQASFGADVITRIGYIIDNPDGLDKLRNVIVSQLNETIKSFGTDTNSIDHAVITANTTMLHIFAGLDPSGIANAPFTPKSLFGDTMTRNESGLDIAESATVFLTPCFSAYVGGDIATGLAAADVDISDETVLYVDIGTNGEIAFGDKSHVDVCSAAAGPAFEGAKIEMGMSGVSGAISHVWLEDRTVKYEVIGGGAPVGICGSGLIDAVAVMLELGVIDETGLLDENFYIDENKKVYISGADIRELQLAKAAISAGILTLVEISGRPVDKVMIAGGFGSFMDSANACKIGLIPSKYRDVITSVGNTAGAGAVLYLLNRDIRERIGGITGNSSYTELSGNMIFMDKFIEQMYFEE